jgi:hypothetical protein
MCSAGQTASSFSNYWYHANWNNIEKKETSIKCNCIEFNGVQANCGQNYYGDPWCYVGKDCNKYYGISTVDEKTPWKKCPSSDSTAAFEDPLIQLYAAEQATLVGGTYKNCRGLYQRTNDKHNAKFIWDRV